MKTINEGNLCGECTSISVLIEISDIEYKRLRYQGGSGQLRKTTNELPLRYKIKNPSEVVTNTN